MVDTEVDRRLSSQGQNVESGRYEPESAPGEHDQWDGDPQVGDVRVGDIADESSGEDVEFAASRAVA